MVKIIKNVNFIGRNTEQQFLLEVANKQESSIIVVYGRRRVGKTELIEQTFRNRNLLKFEGVENKSEIEQRGIFLQTLAKYFNKPSYNLIKANTWIDVFEILAEETQKGKFTIFFEELQWMANYSSGLISELKYVWDNRLRKNSQIKLILCGSSPSFMINKVVFSNALYGRSMHQLEVPPFKINDIKKFLNTKSNQVALEAEMLVGGLPEYLKLLSNDSSIYLGFCKNSVNKNSYFTNEIDKIFLSSLADNSHYRKIIEYLSKVKFATRNEILTKLKLQSGGSTSMLFEDLEKCNFINSYSKLDAKDKSKITRYEISDSYLNSYYRFIKPNLQKIHNKQFAKNPTLLLDMYKLRQSFGYAFERWCRNNIMEIATALGFSDINFEFGVFYNRNLEKKLPGFQIDLAFKRADKVMVFCELKYQDRKIDLDIAKKFSNKVDLIDIPKKFAVQKIIITNADYDKKILEPPFLMKVLHIDEIIKNIK